MIVNILKQLGIKNQPLSVIPFRSQEDGSAYNVWKVDYSQISYVLKQAKGNEASIYRTFFADPKPYVPALLGITKYKGMDYILLEYIAGDDLTICNRSNLIRVLDSLIIMQKDFWDIKLPDSALNSRKNRYNYLFDPYLEAAYREYLDDCEQIPATLCHDDLLPFNALISGDRSVFIDWEVGGILPYPASLARLIAHTADTEDAFFYMSKADQAFAIDYYYEKLLADRGVAYEKYRRSLDLSLFYEYCEWVFVGNKYNTTDSERYKHYKELACHKVRKLGYL